MRSFDGYKETKERLPQRPAAHTLRIRSFVMDSTGKLHPGRPQGKTLDFANTLLQAVFGDRSDRPIRLAEVTVQGIDRMTPNRKSVMTAQLQKLTIDGEVYKIVGSNGSLKYGTAYFAPEPFRTELLKRFQKIPEYGLAYFGILISPMYAMDRVDHATVVVVNDPPSDPDNGVRNQSLGTNDCRGWVSRSLADRLNLPENFQDRAFQFRIAFGPYQGKGCFKIMEDPVARAVCGTPFGFILPLSSLKPGAERLTPDPRVAGIDSFRFAGRVDWGIRDISRVIPYSINYTVTQLATREAIETEFIPYVEAQFATIQCMVKSCSR